MAIGLHSSKCTMSIYPTRNERKQWAKVAKALKETWQLEKFSLSDMTRAALREYVERHVIEKEPAQQSHITTGHS